MPLDLKPYQTSSQLTNETEYTTPRPSDATTTPQLTTTRSEPPPIEFFTPPKQNAIENANQPVFLPNPLINPFNPYENFQPSFQPTAIFFSSTSQTPVNNNLISPLTSSFATFEYPKDVFFNTEPQKNSINTNYLAEAIVTQPFIGICSFTPCLNDGNCIPIIDSNSLFKFRCICKENFNGILCENYVLEQNRKKRLLLVILGSFVAVFDIVGIFY